MSNKNEGQIILYSTSDGKVKVDVRFEDETFWLSQKLIAELFQVERSVITKHLNNIFEEEELDRNSTCAKFTHEVNKDSITNALRSQFKDIIDLLEGGAAYG